MDFKAITLILVLFLAGSMFSACTTTTERVEAVDGQDEPEVVEAVPVVYPGFGIGGFSGPGLGSGGFFGGGIGVFEEE